MYKPKKVPSWPCTFHAGTDSSKKSKSARLGLFWLIHNFFFRLKDIARESGLGGRVKRFAQLVICIQRSIPTALYFLWITSPPYWRGNEAECYGGGAGSHLPPLVWGGRLLWGPHLDKDHRRFMF